MKKILGLVLAAMMMAANVGATVIMTESFERTAGTLNMGANTKMGSNTDDWWTYSGGTGSTPKFIQVEEGTLSYPGYVTEGKGNKAYIWSTDADDFRKFTKEYTSGKVYMAAIINVTELRQGTTPDYFLCLGDGGTSNMYARLYARSVKDANDQFVGFRLGVAKYTETNTTAVRFTNDVIYEMNKNYLVVVEYEFIDGDKNDEVRLYVNPTKTTTKPTLVCLQDSTNAGGTQIGAKAKNDASKIACVNLRQGTNTPRQMFVDEIKIATAWDDLFEEGGDTPPAPTPTINAASSLDFGDVNLNEAAEKTLAISGSDLKGAISVASSSAVLVPAVSSISKAEAEAGYTLSLTLTATEAGSGSANITLSSEGADSKVVSVAWNALAPAAQTLTIAEVKQQAEEAPVALNDVVIIRVWQSGAYLSVQDETGALNLADYYGVAATWKVGDKISGLSGIKLPDTESAEGFCTVFPTAGNVASSGNEIVPFDVTLADFTQYGPALVKVTGVTFPEEAETFAAGSISISQSGTSANLQIPAGCNIIGEEVPASADVKGIVCHPAFTDNIIISESPDVYNRVPKGGDVPVYENLIQNPSFEEYSCNPIFGCSFDDWSGQGSGAAASTTRLEGEVALYMNPTAAAVLDQGVALSDNDYAAGSKFALVLNYNIQSMPADGKFAIDCYWEAAAGGDSEAAEAHESDILRVDLEQGEGWLKKELVTTKPAKSSYFRVRIKVPKGAKVLFDAFSLTYTPSTDPYIEVSPSKLNAVETTLGNTATFQTVHIRQGNLSGKTTFYVGGKDASQFRLSASELPADQSELDLIITYAPTSAGTHSASLIFDNAQHTTILPDMISLSGSCSDPSAKPVLSVTPSTLPEFEVLEGKQQKMTVTLSSVNCTDYVYARVDHISPEEHGTFTIDGSMFGKNSEATVTITFSPVKVGTYQSTLTFYSTGADDVVLTLNGTGVEKTPETIDWQTDFVWNDANPLAWMYEKFETAQHNETMILEGWQNVAAADARPWWGFDESKTTPARGDGKYAKATAYQYGKDSTALWDMWLVTPALDYKNAASKIFAFSVMAEYLADEGNKPQLSVYYIDATGATVYMQDLTSSFDIPSTSDDNLVWRTFILDLASYAETMADVFHMAFRYTGPNGAEGVVTYYIDEVSWGRTDLPLISVTPATIIDTATVNTKKELATLTISGSNLTKGITLSLEGANYNRFSLSATSLPAEGGEVTLSFEGEEVGVHEAYVRLSSNGAPDTFVVIAVLCQEEGQGIETVTGYGLQVTGRKIFRNGRILILRDGKAFDLLGSRVE